MRDLDFISGRFFDYEIPKERKYLLKYFTTDLQIAFLRYYLVFYDTLNFVDHTGYYCSRRLLWKFQTRFLYLNDTYDKAKKSLTEEGMRVVDEIESGKFSLKGKGKGYI